MMGMIWGSIIGLIIGEVILLSIVFIGVGLDNLKNRFIPTKPRQPDITPTNNPNTILNHNTIQNELNTIQSQQTAHNSQESVTS